ncbi:actin organization and endocytosis protein, partial [Basidiobolus ranarum]
MYNNGGNYGSGHLMGGLNPLQLTSGPTSSSFSKLSFLNSAEQTKFEQLFSQHASSNQQLTGEAARDIFLRSKLDSEVLAQIWSMSDINASGSLSFPEFALAMYLINMKLTGQNVPSQLPNNLRQEITSAMQPSANSNVGNPGYYSSGPSIPGVTTPLDGPMNGKSMTSQTSGRGGYQANNLGKSQWAVTSEEKAQFDQIFKSLDNAHSGFLSGEKAKQVFTESGLNKSDLGKIWGLADIHNQGKLNSDEFAVAMHLIYAKLAGQEIPKTLPTNLVPPSTKDLSDSVSSLKQMLKTNSSLKRNATLSSPILGIPTLDFDLDSSSRYSEKKALSRDEDVGYVSGNRRKIGTSPKPSSPSISYSERLAKFDALRKKIKGKQAELDSILTNPSEPSVTSSSNQGADLIDLKDKIRNLQDSIYEISVTSNDLPRGGVNQNPENQRVERKQLESEFSEITKELADLTKKAHTLDEKLASSKLELFKASDAKLYKTAPPKTNLANLFPFKAAGSSESLSDADRLKQKAAEMLAQRMQALTKNNASSNDPSAMEAKKRLDTETEKINAEKKGNEKHLREIEDSIHHLQEEIRGSIRRSSNSIEQS